MYSLMKPPIIMNVHNVRVRKLCLFLTFSLSSTTGGGCFSGGFSISVLRATSVSFSDDAGTLGLLAGTGGFTSAGAGAETWWTGRRRRRVGCLRGLIWGATVIILMAVMTLFSSVSSCARLLV